MKIPLETKMRIIEADAEITRLRSALAAKSAEVEGLLGVIKRIASGDLDGYRSWLAARNALNVLENDAAAMEKNNEHQDQ